MGGRNLAAVAWLAVALRILIRSVIPSEARNLLLLKILLSHANQVTESGL